MKRFTVEDFVKRAREVHGGKYDYSKVEYKNNKIKVCIICPEHGEFWQTPSSHLDGNGCPKCSIDKRKTDYEKFFADANAIHGGFYSYDKSTYNGTHSKIRILCPKHGEFWQIAGSHMTGQRCPKCWEEIKVILHTSNTDEFIEKAKAVHSNYYDYSKVNYTHKQTKVCIICPKHGEFWQTPNDHLDGCGCPTCGKIKCAEKRKLNTDEYIKKAIAKHGDKYDYSEVKYLSARSKIKIICQKHGAFWQDASSHLYGAGCPKCKETKLEYKVESILESIGKNYVYQYRDKNIFGFMSLDFYLPKYNVAIECQGIQHFKPTDFAGRGKEWAEKEFVKTIERDNLKKNLCKNNNIKLLYYDGNNFKDAFSGEEIVLKNLLI